MRSPRDSKAAAALQDLQHKAVYSTGTGGDAAGGYAVPEQIAAGIDRILMDISPMRQVANVVTASSKDFKVLVDTRGTSTGWVGEKGTRSETNTPQLAEVAPNFGTLYAYTQATEESLQDIFFNVEAWLTSSVGEQMAKAEGDAFTDGDGSNKPTGFLAGTKVATSDATRTFGQLQYIPTGKAGTFGTISTTSPVHYPADCLFDTIHALKAGYRANSRWMMNKATLGVLRKLKDSEGNYIWVPGMEMGAASSLLGFPVVESEEMADIGANTYPVAFGDFRAGYLICDLVGMRMTVDEVTTPGYIKFYLRRRVGGKLLKDEAIKLIKCAAS
jgi:HK97 family phage major capsid protein